jgi:hypothetical protein
MTADPLREAETPRREDADRKALLAAMATHCPRCQVPYGEHGCSHNPPGGHLDDAFKRLRELAASPPGYQAALSMDQALALLADRVRLAVQVDRYEADRILAGSELDWLIGYLSETDEHAAVHVRRARAALSEETPPLLKPSYPAMPPGLNTKEIAARAALAEEETIGGRNRRPLLGVLGPATCPFKTVI